MNEENLFKIIMSILNVLFGILFIILAYITLDKPLCDGGTTPFIYPVIIGTTGIINIMIGLYRMLDKKNQKGGEKWER